MRGSLFYILQNILDRMFPVPTSEERREILRFIILKYGLRIFIETGTAQGYTIDALRDNVDRIISIEADEELYRKAKKRFHKDNNISILHGNSGERLDSVVEKLTQPALIFLDAHNHDETPILDELRAILAAPQLGHIIVIDDARLFGRCHGFPSLKTVKMMIKDYGKMSVKDDAIIIIPNRKEKDVTI